MKRIKENGTKFFNMFSTFGLLIMVKWLFFRLLNCLTKYIKIDIYNKYIYNFLDDFVKHASIYVETPNVCNENTGKIPVWCFWGQGIDNAPEIIRTCVESHKNILKKNELFEYHLLDYSDVKKMKIVEDRLFELVESGTLSFTHFCDVLRCKLLYKYGGLYIDAAFYMTDFICEDINNYNFYSIKKNLDGINYKSRTSSKGRWVVGAMYSKPGYLLFDFLNQFFEMYLKKFDTFIDYFMLDALIDYAYNNYEIVRKDIDEIPINNTMIYELEHISEKAYNKTEYDRITAHTHIHNITHKREHKKYDTNNQLTFYGFIIENTL